jgi:basic membrane lipoprotein Med (substrate-binding protein (PBP1-ABC) superfamily)
MVLTPEKEGAIVRALANQSSLAVGLEFGLDKHYGSTQKVRNAVNNIYKKVMRDPSKYGIGEEVLGMIKQGMRTRSLTTTHTEAPTLHEQGIDSRDIGQVVGSVRDKTWKLIDKKLDRYTNSKKRLDEISFQQLGTLAGISFDKGQILQGKATENIAVLGKLQDGLSPQEMLELALKAREQNVAEKHA